MADKQRTSDRIAGLFDNYEAGSVYDELFGAKGKPHPDAARVVSLMQQIGRAEFKQRQRLADAA
jgi:uncharacterized circularly permuted ATP-grasp superfamily protein